jgi:hypothetical protein
MKLKVSSLGRPGHKADGKIEIAGADRRQDIRVDTLQDVKTHAWMCALESDDRSRQQTHGNGRRGTHADFTDTGPLDRFDVVTSVTEFRFDRRDTREQRLSRLGRSNAVCATMQELNPEIVLQLLDALGYRRLRKVEILGCLSDRARVDHGGKIAKLTKLHWLPGEPCGDRKMLSPSRQIA